MSYPVGNLDENYTFGPINFLYSAGLYVAPAVLAMVSINGRLDGHSYDIPLWIAMSCLGVAFVIELVRIMKETERKMSIRRMIGVAGIGLIAASFGVMANSTTGDNIISDINFPVYGVDGTIDVNTTYLEGMIAADSNGKASFDADCVNNTLTPSVGDFGASGTRTANIMFVLGFMLAGMASVTLLGERDIPQSVKGISTLVTAFIVIFGGLLAGWNGFLPEKFDEFGYVETRGENIYTTRETMMIFFLVFMALLVVHDIVGAMHRKGMDWFAKIVIVLSAFSTAVALIGTASMMSRPADNDLAKRLYQITGEASSYRQFVNFTRDVPPAVMACVEGTFDGYRDASFAFSFVIPAAILHGWRAAFSSGIVEPSDE